MKNKSIFDLNVQQSDTTGKIVVALERISEAFRVLLWEQGKSTGLTPIQIQILIFLKHHDRTLCNITYMAREFNMTKPTISDSVKALDRKGLIEKIPDGTDSRSYSIVLTVEGSAKTKNLEDFASPIQQSLDFLTPDDQGDILKTLTQLVFTLNRAGIINVQRTCLACRYYARQDDKHYCALLEKPLSNNDLRLDCPEFSEKTS